MSELNISVDPETTKTDPPKCSFCRKLELDPTHSFHSDFLHFLCSSFIAEYLFMYFLQDRINWDLASRDVSARIVSIPY